MENTGKKIWLTPAELAETLNISVRTVRRLRSMGKIPSVQVTSTLPRFSVAEVVEALRHNKDVARDNE